MPAEAAGIADEWPTVRQICRLWRSRQIKKNGQWQEAQETVYLITSLSPAHASPQAILQTNRDHWGIENKLHWIRDMSLGEDACRVRTGEAPEVLAAVRNSVLRLIRSSGLTEIAATLRRHAAKPLEAIHLVMSFAPS